MVSAEKSRDPAEARAERRRTLMKRVQEGDADAYRVLLDDIRPAVLHFLRRCSADRDDLQDLVQEVLLALHRSRHSYDPLQPFEPWLFAIVRYVASRLRRRRIRRMSREILVEEIDDRPYASDEGPGSSDLEGQAGLADVLDRLSPTQREAFTLLKLEGRSVEDAARQAGTTVGALKVRAHRAYKAIRRMLER